MSVLTDYTISVKEYDKISKAKDLEIEIEKNMRDLNINNVPITMGTLGMIKKRTGKRRNKIPDSPSQCEIPLCRTTQLLRINVSRKVILKKIDGAIDVITTSPTPRCWVKMPEKDCKKPKVKLKKMIYIYK